jgi:hypothetical protein
MTREGHVRSFHLWSHIILYQSNLRLLLFRAQSLMYVFKMEVSHASKKAKFKVIYDSLKLKILRADFVYYCAKMRMRQIRVVQYSITLADCTY